MSLIITGSAQQHQSTNCILVTKEEKETAFVLDNFKTALATCAHKVEMRMIQSRKFHCHNSDDKDIVKKISQP
jgi:hypothetical protein